MSPASVGRPARSHQFSMKEVLRLEVRTPLALELMIGSDADRFPVPLFQEQDDAFFRVFRVV